MEAVANDIMAQPRRQRHIADKFRRVVEMTMPDDFILYWVPTGSSLGPGDQDIETADMMAMTWNEFRQNKDLIAEHQMPIQLFEIPNSAPDITMDDYLGHLIRGYDTTVISVQKFTRQFPSSLKIPEAVSQFQKVRQQPKLHANYPPMNMLSIRGSVVFSNIPHPFPEVR